MTALDGVLAAAERYARIKRELELDGIETCRDWDCGLANDLAGLYAEDHHKQLDEAKAALEATLNAYVDARIQAALKGMSR